LKRKSAGDKLLFEVHHSKRKPFWSESDSDEDS